MNFIESIVPDNDPKEECVNPEKLQEELAERKALLIENITDPEALENLNANIVVQFVPPEVFKSKIIEDRKGILTDNIPDLDKFIAGIVGIRTFNSNEVLVNTHWKDPKTDSWVPVNNLEVLVLMGTHEMVHGLLKPKIVNLDDGSYKRKTGCKVVSVYEGVIFDTKNIRIYEAQTDLIATWLDLKRNPKFEKLSSELKYKSVMRNPEYASISRMLLHAFPDFDEGMRFLLNQYYSCNEAFLENLLNQIETSYVSKDIKIPEKLIKDIISNAKKVSGDETYKTFNESVSTLSEFLVLADLNVLAKKLTKLKEAHEKNANDIVKNVKPVKAVEATLPKQEVSTGSPESNPDLVAFKEWTKYVLEKDTPPSKEDLEELDRLVKKLSLYLPRDRREHLN